MSIYHLSAQMITRKAGRSSVAAAAYRSGEKIVDSETSAIHDFTRKSGVDYSEIMTPSHAPELFKNRADLWNAVEKIETRKNSQLARELNIALPDQLSKKQQIELAREYSQSFVELGMIADLNCHDLDSHNPHFHLMLTTRECDSTGFTVKNRSWNDRSMLQKWRKDWATLANQHLEKAGFDERIDHRTLAEQGIKRAPTKHHGPHISNIIKEGGHSYVYERQLAQQAAEQAIIDERVKYQESLEVELDQANKETEDLENLIADLKLEIELEIKEPAQPAIKAQALTLAEAPQAQAAGQTADEIAAEFEAKQRAKKKLEQQLKREQERLDQVILDVQRRRKKISHRLFNTEAPAIKEAEKLIPKLKLKIEQLAKKLDKLKDSLSKLFRTYQTVRSDEEEVEFKAKADRKERMLKSRDQFKRNNKIRDLSDFKDRI